MTSKLRNGRKLHEHLNVCLKVVKFSYSTSIKIAKIVVCCGNVKT